jgi:hypothetical protein
MEAKQRDRAERTLQYVERYSSGEYASSAMMMDEALDLQFGELQAVLTNPNLTPEETEKQYTEFILGLFSDPELRRAMNRLLRFHEELVQCVINELCDREITLSFFNNSTVELLRTYYPYICEKRAKWNDPDAYRLVEQFYLEKSGVASDVCKPS